MKLRGLDLVGKWTPEEARVLVGAMEPLPKAWVEENPHVQSIIRRDVLQDAPPEAPGHSKYEPGLAAIVVFDKGVYHDGRIDPEQFRRSVYHELGHAILRDQPETIHRWQQDTSNDGFVDEYAKTNPEEDFCDTFSEFFIHPDQTHKVVPTKAAFLQDLLDRAQREKIAMHFLGGFQDEIVKTARGGIRRLAELASRAKASRTPGRMSVGKGLALGAAAGLGGAEYGIHKGRKKGYAKGTEDVSEIAQRARMIGRKEGVMAYHQALMRYRRSQEGGQ